MNKKNLFRNKNLSFGLKFILLVISLTVILLVSLSYLASSSIYRMGQSSQDISTNALKYQAWDHLIQVTRDNAQKNNLIVGSIQKDAEILAEHASDIFESPEIFVPGAYWDAEEHMFPGPEGQYLNSEEELASAFSPNFSGMNDEAIRDHEVIAYLDFIVPHVQENSPGIAAIYFGTEGEVTRYYPNINLGTLVPPDFQITQRPWYLSANAENNPDQMVMWSPVYVDATGCGLMITAAAPVYINDDEFLGVIGIDVTLDAITLNMEATKLPGRGYFLLIDNHGHAVAMPEEGYNDFMGRPSEEGEFAPNVTSEARLEFTSLLDNIATEKNGFTTAEINGTELFIAFSKMNNTGWALVSVVRAESILQSIAQLQDEMRQSTNILIFGNILPVGFTLLVIIIVIGSLLTNHMMKPVRKLSETAHQIATGRWNVETANPVSEDEIGQLTNSFNFMISELKKSRAELEKYSIDLERKVKERTKELDEKVIKLTESEAANLSILEDLNETIANLEKAEEEIKEKNVDLKKVQLDLSSLNKELEHKVRERTVEVEKLLKQKDEFIGQLGHDLKNPLNPLVNLLPVLEEREHDYETKKIFEVVNRNVGYMRNLVVKTIELARLNSPNTELIINETNLLDEVNNVVEKNKLSLEGNNMKINNNIDGNIIVKADKLRIEELFDNLIINAIKYSKNMDTITIDAKEDKDFVTVSIKDTGIGITEEQLSHIFDEFYKADEARHDFDSSGLGLPICKRIVEKHGGKIWVESPGDGGGTTFYFTIPTGSKTK